MKPSRKLLKRIIGGGVGALVLAVALTVILAKCGRPLTSRPLSPPVERDAIAWWRNPPPLTADEVACRRWIASITFDLPRERWPEHWNVGGGQFGIFSIRYQAAFTAYAAAALGMRTPAYPEWTRRVLASVMDHLVDRHTWIYADRLWPSPNGTDPCASENIMYTGHLLHTLALYEAMTGDPRYRIEGFDLRRDSNTVYHYTTTSLADVTVRQMRANPSGGVTCEPGLIFFPCNNHPQVALRMMEGMGLGDWSAERAKWERWALDGYGSRAGPGIFSILYHQRTKCFVQVGYDGLDGWSLLWYAPWASDPALARDLWRRSAEGSDWGWLDETPVEKGGEASCCASKTVPRAASACFLGAAARACGDPERAAAIEAWLDRHFRKEEGGRLWWDTRPEWCIGVSANRALSLALANGSDLRALIQNPLPRDYFKGPLLDSVDPADTPVYQAWQDQGRLVLELDGGGRDVTLHVRNLPGVNVEKAEPPTLCDIADGQLILRSAARVRLVLASRP